MSNSHDSYFRPLPEGQQPLASTPPPGFGPPQPYPYPPQQPAGQPWYYGAPQPQPVVAQGPPPKGVDDPRLNWKTGLLGIAMAIGIVAITLIVFVAVAVAGFGTDATDSRGFTFIASVLQDAGLVAAAYLAVRTVVPRPTWETFGFRKIGWDAIGWAALALVSFFVISFLYIAVISQFVDLPKDGEKVDDQLGPLLTAIFAICIAPPVEEFFFRGLIFRSFRNGLGIPGAVIVSGLIFGAIHFGSAEPIFIPMLAILGMILAVLYQKTNSLWACIILHATYNGIIVAFGLG